MYPYQYYRCISCCSVSGHSLLPNATGRPSLAAAEMELRIRSFVLPARLLHAPRTKPPASRTIWVITRFGRKAGAKTWTRQKTKHISHSVKTTGANSGYPCNKY